MDGTLLNSSSKLSRENRAALHRFVDGGGLFTVATGRMEKSVLPYLRDLPVNVPAIVYNGAAIYDFNTDQLLWQDSLGTEVLLPVAKVMEQFAGIGVQCYHGGSTYFVTENGHTDAHRIREGFKPIHSSLEEIPQPWFKVILAWDPPKLREVEDYLKEFDGGFRQVYSEPQFLELLSPNASKGGALKVLADMLGLRSSCIISMGDNLNDMELIREADIGIAVENAHHSLKAIADLCGPHHDKNAVAEVIGWIEEGKICEQFDSMKRVILHG